MNKPHIVKFSGGRSSGMMLMELLKQKKLVPERGDVILFNNTSAEHPATYDFTRKMKALAEGEYNIPFFWIEYQTYEEAGRNGWLRKGSYKIVNDQPYSADNEHGYRSAGEVFEEMISLSGFLPNMQNRICTQTLKIFITNSFLSDWFAQKPGIERLGHYGDAARMADEDVIETHEKSNGSTPERILLQKRAFVRNAAFVREEAAWKDFVDCDLRFDNEEVKRSVIGDKGQLFGDNAISYISCLGIRKDEEIRAEKIQARIDAAKKNPNGRSLMSQPPGEEILTPLVENDVSQQGVIDFWNKQDFNLELSDDGNFSNCVYCPLKGKAKLTQLAATELAEGGLNGSGATPASIDWWIEMEDKYGRDLKREGRKVTSDKGVKFIGFFGATEALVYRQIKAQAMAGADHKSVNSINGEFVDDDSYIPCNCTD